MTKRVMGEIFYSLSYSKDKQLFSCLQSYRIKKTIFGLIDNYKKKCNKNSRYGSLGIPYTASVLAFTVKLMEDRNPTKCL